MRIERLAGGPIVRPHMDARMGENVNGPSLVRAPDWVQRPLGRYYLYFGHHQGTYIRLAYADALTGPWRTHPAGVLDLAETPFAGHIASPDVHVDPQRREVRLYYHGPLRPEERAGPLGRWGGQATRVAVSADGLRFTSREEVLGAPYLRVLRHGDWHYALGMPGHLFRSRDGLSGFEEGPNAFAGVAPGMRHAAFLRRGDDLRVFYTNRGDCPERVLVAGIDLRAGWPDWRPGPPAEVLAPETAYEGAGLPLVPSEGGKIDGPARQLRDPAIFEEDGQTYLLYAVAGEQGLAIARLTDVEERGAGR
jgi:hypothetical protein